MEKKVTYRIIGKWANGHENILTTTTSPAEAYDLKAEAVKRYPDRPFKIIRVTYETIASYEPGMEDANDDQG